MTPIRLLASSVVAVAFASCASKPSDEYDTSNPYGVADSGQSGSAASQAPAASSNPVYDTPAAYEESTGTTPAPDASAPNLPAPATTPRSTTVKPGPAARPAAAARPAVPAASAAGGVHVVAKGDSLWSISKKYNVPVTSIKTANNMTSDVVVLGKKLIIPAH